MFSMHNLYAALAAIITLLLLALVLRAPVLIDVKIYEHRESGELIYCSTGTLADPPWRFVGSGAVQAKFATPC